MKYSSHTRETREPLKRLAHSRRLEQAAALLPISVEMKILDYGCGDGALFECLEKYVPAKNLHGFDPNLLGETTFAGAMTYDNAETLVAQHHGEFDVVYCMEVCEHLNHEARFELFRNLLSVAKADATVVIGVPIAEDSLTNHASLPPLSQ